MAQHGVEVGAVGVGLDAANKVRSDVELLALLVVQTIFFELPPWKGR